MIFVISYELGADYLALLVDSYDSGQLRDLFLARAVKDRQAPYLSLN